MAKLTPEILLAFISIDRESSSPKYLQLYAQIRDAVVNGKLKPGERMPSSRALALELGISRNSVVTAYDQLSIEGYLTGETGSGTFICTDLPDFLNTADEKRIKERIGLLSGNVSKRNIRYEFPSSEEEMRLDSEGDIAIPFQLTVNDLSNFPFQIWSRLGARAFRHLQYKNLGYSDAKGYEPLRIAIADYLRVNRSIICEKEQILIVNGARQALHLAAELLIKEGDDCWVEDPGYPGVRNAVKRFGGEICPVPVTEHGMDIQYGQEKYPDARLAFITPSHQFPLGKVMPLKQRLELLKWSREGSNWIIEDDYDSEFRFKGRPVPALMGLDPNANVVYIGTFSKIMFPALRIAYMVLPDKETAERFTFMKTMVDRQNPLMDQEIMSEFIVEGHFLRHIRRMRLIYKNNQEMLVSLLVKYLHEELTVDSSDSGMFLIGWLREGLKAKTIKERANREGIVLFAVSDFSIENKIPEGLVIGFTGFKPKDIEDAVQKLTFIIKDMTHV